jgi:thymidylate synthase (FAD)
MDPLFRVEVIAQTANPQQTVWLSAHQCVCENAAIDDDVPAEENAGLYVVKHLLAGNRGHYSPLEAPQISFNVVNFNHATMQQVTRHRIGVHFSVQSGRYTGQRIIDVAKGLRDIEEVFYLRPLGDYTDRQGAKYTYDTVCRAFDKVDCQRAAERYRYKVEELGMAEEHARELIPYAIRQHWVMSFNVRSLMHLLDLRWSKAAELECQQLCDLIWPHFQAWVPAIADWYEQNRAKKARLAP